MEQRNLLLAVVLSVAILLSFQFLFEKPLVEPENAAQQQTAQPQTVAPPGSPPLAGAPPVAAPQVTAPGGAAPSVPVVGGAAGPEIPKRDNIIKATTRVELSSRRLHGSVAVKGARIDDLTLADYRETIDETSPEITLLSPSRAPNPYFASFGWASATPGVAVPGPETVWRANRTKFGPANPLTLSWNNGQGLTFEQMIAIDRNYMFTVTQRVRNAGEQPVVLYPYGLVSRTGTPEVTRFFILHEGLIGVFEDTLSEVDYDDLQDEDGSIADGCRSDARFATLPAAARPPEKGTIEKCTTGGWIGITDKYWLTALIPDQKSAVGTRFKYWLENKEDKYQVDFLGTPQTLKPGAAIEATSRLFAGAKEVRLLESYQEDLGIARFELAVDWGWLWFLTQPIFKALSFFNGFLGNFGLAILLLTVLIKLAFFPLANKSYRAMSRLKKLQPKMVEIRETFKDDRVRQNQEMMGLYKKQNANPMAGCFPILIQIPVFFSLYKVLFVTIEMRHAPFFGWIHDLSAPDPLGLLTAFGLIQWNVPEMLDIVNIGIWPIIMGGSMFLQQRLNPQPADPTQAKIFMMLPIVFTFLLGRFPAGLVIYWAWNNLLSIAQQWVIMRRMGVTASGQSTTPTGGGPGKLFAGLGAAGGRGTAKAAPKGTARGGGTAKAAPKGTAGSGGTAKAAPKGAAQDTTQGATGGAPKRAKPATKPGKKKGSGKRKRARRKAS